MKLRRTLALLSRTCLVALAGAGLAPAVRGLSPLGTVHGAEQTTAALTQALVAAVGTLSDAVPPGSPPEEIAAASAAVSMIFSQAQSYRLIDATGSPIGPAGVARDRFEQRALGRLEDGASIVQEVVGGELRTLVPLTSDMHANCVTCHTGYAELAPNTVVGAAALRIGL